MDTGVEGNARRAATFVSGTAYQILGRALRSSTADTSELLTPGAIHPHVAAPLLFLVAEQIPDAREAARPLIDARSDDLVRTALLETIHDLASERFESILERAERLASLRPTADAELSLRANQALYGLCWSGVVHLVARLLRRAAPQTSFRDFVTPEAAFDRVVSLATEKIALPGDGGHLISIYGGPRHLARLLRHVSGALAGAGVAELNPPDGVDGTFWRRWLNHRIHSKPML